MYFLNEFYVCLILVLLQMGNNSRRYAELAGRLEPLGADVMMSLIDMGLFTSVSSLLAYAKRSNRAVLPNPGPSIQPQVPSSLQSGTRMTHPSYMPSHMPLFPDSQTYIRTPVSITSFLFWSDLLSIFKLFSDSQSTSY